MKKTLIAAAALTLAAGAAQAQMTIYGLIDLSYGQSILSDYLGEDPDFHSGGDNGSSEGNSTTRIGLKGSMEVASGIKANFNLETGGIDSDGGVNNGGDFFNRQMWAGLSGGWGEVRLGKQDSVVYHPAIANAECFAQRRVQWHLLGRLYLQRRLAAGSPVAPAELHLAEYGRLQGAGGIRAQGQRSRRRGHLCRRGDLRCGRSVDFGCRRVRPHRNQQRLLFGRYSLGIVAHVAGLNIGAMYAQNSDTDATGYELFINKEVFKNTYFYAEYGSVDETTATSIKGDGFAVGMIFTF